MHSGKSLENVVKYDLWMNILKYLGIDLQSIYENI